MMMCRLEASCEVTYTIGEVREWTKGSFYTIDHEDMNEQIASIKIYPKIVKNSHNVYDVAFCLEPQAQFRSIHGD